MSSETVPHTPYVPERPPLEAATAFFDVMKQRRTVRDFSDRDVEVEVIRTLVQTAASAPSGANKQPWRFVCVRDADTKRRIREAAEEEEREFYARRASKQWLRDLAPLGTDWRKPFLETAPWLIVVFRLTKTDDERPVYYSQESVGLASGFLLAAAHQAGLVTLTHTPSPMGFLCEVLDRPPHERPFLLVPVGYPAEACEVPKHALARKPLDEVMVIV